MNRKPLLVLTLLGCFANSIAASPYSFEETLDIMEGLPLDSATYKQSGLMGLAMEMFENVPDVAQDCDDHEGLFYFFLDASYQNNTDKLAQATDAIQRHGNLCRPTYWQKFIDRAQTDEYQAAKRSADEIIAPDDIESIFSAPELRDNIRKTGVYELFSARKNHLLKNWINLTEADHDLVENHCDEFCERTRDIFLPAKLDLILDDDRISEIIPADGAAASVEQFKDAWLKFRVCASLMVKSNADDNDDDDDFEF